MLQFVKMAIGGPLKKAVARRMLKLLKPGGTYISDWGISLAFSGINSFHQNNCLDGVDLTLEYTLLGNHSLENVHGNMIKSLDRA